MGFNSGFKGLIKATFFNVMVLFIIQNILEQSYAKEIYKQTEADFTSAYHVTPSDW